MEVLRCEEEIELTDPSSDAIGWLEINVLAKFVAKSKQCTIEPESVSVKVAVPSFAPINIGHYLRAAIRSDRLNISPVPL